MNKEILKALEADGEKLRQLTGEDHGPYFPDHDCVILDGACDCEYPFLNCKYLDKIEDKSNA